MLLLLLATRNTALGLLDGGDFALLVEVVNKSLFACAPNEWLTAEANKFDVIVWIHKKSVFDFIASLAFYEAT